MIVRRLLKWHKRLPNNPQFDSSIEVFQSYGGLGIRAIKDLPSAQTVIRVPASGWRDFSAEVSVNEAKRSNPEFFENLNNLAALVLPNSSEQADTLIKSSCLATKLIIDGQESLKQPYIEFLSQATYPGDNSLLPHPLIMRDHEFGGAECLLSGSSAHRAIIMRRKLYDYIGASLFGSNNTMVNEFKWAMGIVLSRALSSAPLGMPLTLVPVLDLVNHSYAEQNADHRYNKVTGEFSLITTKAVKAGSELFINYGEGRDTVSFMSLYGFYDADNRNDDVSFILDTTRNGSSDPLSTIERREAFISWRDIVSTKHSVLINPMPKNKMSTTTDALSTVRISAITKLPLDFLLSFNKDEGEEILGKLLRIVETEDKGRLELCNEVVAAAHKALGQSILGAARSVVAASADTENYMNTLAPNAADGAQNDVPLDVSGVVKTNLVENEILAAQLIIASINKSIHAFVPSIQQANTLTNAPMSPVSLIMNERAPSPTLIAAEARLQHLLAQGAEAATLLAEDRSGEQAAQDPSNLSPTPPTATSSPPAALLQWRIATAAVAAKELDALLRLRSFCTAFLIALASSL